MTDLRGLAKEYHDQNGFQIQTLDLPPSSLQFSRLVRISRPVKIKGLRIPAAALWTNEYLCEKMADKLVSIAVTPNGRADAVCEGPNGQIYFVEPHIEKMSFADFMAKLNGDQPEVYYLQSQNGNIYSANETHSSSEYEALQVDVPPEISWCSEALDRKPDAVNLWIGNGESITSIHCDPYENIYTVVRGVKYFTLLPPTDACYLKEKYFPHASFSRESPGSGLQVTPTANAPRVRWSTIMDPSRDLSPDAHPIHVTLRAGESMYLPPGWWHYVRQAAEITIALNWWYDMDMEGMVWVVLNYLRGDAEDSEEHEARDQ